MRHPVIATGLGFALLLVGTGCAGVPSASPSPLVVRIADIQSGTIHVRMNQVVEIDTRGLTDHYTPLIANEHIVTVVLRRDDLTRRFEPEIVPHRVGTTQVALVASNPLGTIGFTVIVSR